MAKQEKLIKTKDRVKKHGEVFTPVKIVNDMLNMEGLKEKIEDIRATILEPSVGEGVFLTEILKRRFNKILNESSNILEFENNALISLSTIYGIELLEDNVKKCRINIYKCFFYYYNKAICKFNSKIKDVVLDNTKKIICLNIIQGNFLTKKNNDNKLIVLTKWNNIDDTISFCDNFDKKEEIEDWNDMKFDVAIGNPPYQEMDGGGTGDSSKPIYNLFINNVINYQPQFLSFIIPSRWMKGGKGLNNFRTQMMEDKRLKEITDFENAKHIFSNVDIDGGVCYFLWDSNYNGKVKYSYIMNNEEKIISYRYLKTNYSDTIIRDIRQCSIIEKIYNINKDCKKFDSLVSSRNPYGFATDLFNNPKKYPIADLQLNKKDEYFKVYGVKGKNGGAKRIIGYINPKSVTKNIENIEKYKLFFSYAYSTNSTTPPELIIGLPNQISTETFLEIGVFNTLEETENCLKYIKTKLFRALLFFNRIQKNVSKQTFKTIPMQDFTNNSDIDWNKSIDEIDEQLFKKYGLDEEEINYIKQNIKPMQ